MGCDLAFWKDGSAVDSAAAYQVLVEDDDVTGIPPVDHAVVGQALRSSFARWQQEQNLWTYQPDADGNGPGFDLHIGRQIVVFTCYGLLDEQLNEIIDVMNRLGFPLYDPQVDKRFMGMRELRALIRAQSTT